MKNCQICGKPIADTDERVVVEIGSYESEGAERAGHKNYDVFSEWSRHWRSYHRACFPANTGP